MKRVAWEEIELVFPLEQKPLNILAGKYSNKAFNGNQGANTATYKSTRPGNRLHAGRDLYTKPFTPVLSMGEGTIIKTGDYYKRTDEITIRHTCQYKENYNLIVRYGELDPNSISIKKGDTVKKGQIIGNTGSLLNEDDSPFYTIKGIPIYMVHIEMYDGSIEGTPPNNTKNWKNPNKFYRREDGFDPLIILNKIFNNQF